MERRIRVLLSACLIVKNEAHVIERCLKSLEGVADEIIVVDTGSTDDTPRIAAAFGARVYQAPWTGDFGEARNRSLQHAQGDYVLVIDADEFLPQEDGKRLRRAIEAGEADAYTVDLVNYVGSVARFVRAPGVRVVRVFRRGFTYQGTIHEQILPQIAARGGRVQVLDVELHHLGYLAEFVAMKGKPDRNLSILKQVLDQDPENLFHLTNLMAEYARINQPERVIEVGERAYAIAASHLVTEPHLVLRLYRMLAAAYGDIGDSNRLERLASEGEQLFPSIPDLPFIHGVYEMKQGRWHKAIRLFERCLEIGPVRSEIVDTIAGAGSFVAAAKLGELWLLEGDVERARDYFVQSLRANPRQEGVFFFLASLLPLGEPPVWSQLWRAAEHDPVCLAYLAIAGAMWRQDWVWSALNEIDHTPVTSPILAKLRASGVALGKLEPSSFPDEPAAKLEQRWFEALLAINRREGDLARSLLQDQPERLAQLEPWLSGGTPLHIGPLLDELLLVRAHRLLLQSLPQAADRDEVLSRVLASPLRDMLHHVAWRGERGWECDFLATAAFHRRDIATSLEWLERGLAYEPTVRRAVMEADLALAHRNVDHASTVVRQARAWFPSSDILRHIEERLHVTERQARSLDELLEEGTTMHPHRAYQMSVATMPLKVKIVKLHERAVECVDQVMELVKQGDIMGARTYIQYVQDIITFLRSNLDVSTEAGKAANASYGYFYKMLVGWFLQPARVAEEYLEMRQFWQSWADTWAKVQA